MLERDYFFEFAGMPKSGKTTVTDVVSHYLKRSGYRIGEYHGGGRFAPIDKKALPELNVYLACEAVRYLISQSQRERIVPRIFLMDRGIVDRTLFTATIARMGKIEGAEEAALINFLMLPRHRALIDGVFVFVTDVDISIQRESQHKLTPKLGRVMNNDFLSLLRAVTLDRYKEIKQSFAAILIDTAKLNNKIEDTARMIVDSILNTIEGDPLTGQKAIAHAE